MYVATVPNRGARPTYLIRQGKRHGRKVVKTTLANISKLPDDIIDYIRILLRGGIAVDDPQYAFQHSFRFTKGIPHGNVAAVLGCLRDLELHSIIATKDSKQRRLAIALIADRILNPKSKLATSAALHPDSATHSLGTELGLESIDEDDLYQTMDWLLKRKSTIEERLARQHLEEGSLVLCDVSSTYVEGEALELAEYGYSRDKKKGKKQIVFGLLTGKDGCPVAVEVFAADPNTLAPQIAKIQQQFGLLRIVLVGDRGLLTEARIRKEVKPAGFDWISALKKSGIRKIVEAENLQLSLFDEQGFAEITTAVYPGERIVLCRNPLRARASAYNRERRLAQTEKALEKIVVATRRKGNPLRSMKAISFRVGKLIGKWKMEKHFDLDIKEGFFSYKRNADSIASEASLDGMYAIRTSLKEPTAEEVVRDYKRLSAVEQAFRSLKTVDLKVRPIHHYKTRRVICHVFLCMLAYFVEWHMKQRLAPILFAEDDPEGKKAARCSIIHAAGRSPSAEQKARSKRTRHKALSFAVLMGHLGTLCKHQVEPLIGKKGVSFTMLGEMTNLQACAFELLRVKLR